MAYEGERALRRHAIHIAAQLPEGQADALAVLEYCKVLVVSYMGEPGLSYPQPGEIQPRVVALRGSPMAPSRFASATGSPSALPK